MSQDSGDDSKRPVADASCTGGDHFYIQDTHTHLFHDDPSVCDGSYREDLKELFDFAQLS